MGELIFKGAGGTSCLSAITLHKIAVVMVAPSLTSWACLLDEVILDDTTYDWFVSELISKLENTPVLKSLVIYHDLHALTDKNDRPIAIPSLLLLKIHCMLSSQRQHISHLFFLIRASNLESLILDFPHHNRMSMFIDLLHEQPLSAKFPQLHILSLHLHWIHDNLLVKLSDLFSTMTFILSMWESGHALLWLLDASHGDIHWYQL